MSAADTLRVAPWDLAAQPAWWFKAALIRRQLIADMNDMAARRNGGG